MLSGLARSPARPAVQIAMSTLAVLAWSGDGVRSLCGNSPGSPPHALDAAAVVELAQAFDNSPRCLIRGSLLLGWVLFVFRRVSLSGAGASRNQ